ncbi:MAG: hypothetical protein PHI32_14855 [Dysgonamonadaceae bacterium]|nr:hypothetical protein [Dysgonamonadaceae bacterium]MDD4729646.1 hypothetical protein [Dysgonamonadaceae bacterium]
MKKATVFIFFLLLLFLSTGMTHAQSKTTGFLIDLSVGGIKLNSSAYNIGLLTITPYYKPTDNLSIGVGTGLLMLGNSNIEIASMPIFAYGRWDFLTGKRITPFISGRAGYGIITEKDKYTYLIFDENMEMNGVNQVDRSYTGGLFSSFTVGFLYHLRRNKALSFAIGPKFQKMTAKDNIGTEPYFQNNYNNLSLSLDVGFVF